MAKRKLTPPPDPEPVPAPELRTPAPTRDAATARRLLDELSRKVEGPPLQLNLRPMSALFLACVVQRALRDPELAQPPRDVCTTFVHGIQNYFADCYAVVDVIAAGDDGALYEGKD